MREASAESFLAKGDFEVTKSLTFAMAIGNRSKQPWFQNSKKSFRLATHAVHYQTKT
jgi:hypothetical protein